MTDKDCLRVATKGWNGVTADYADPEENRYNEPFCIDRLLHSELESLTTVQT